jgi:hypothetical protein
LGYRFTIDKNLNGHAPPPEGMAVLRRWKSEGKIELFDAEPAPGMSQPMQPNGRNGRNTQKLSKAASAKTTFSKLAPILFPTRDVTKLNMQEINDVAHLAIHCQSGNDIFVSSNPIFSEVLGRKRLASIGVVTKTPEEAVQYLAEKEGWK